MEWSGLSIWKRVCVGHDGTGEGLKTLVTAMDVSINLSTDIYLQT